MSADERQCYMAEIGQKGNDERIVLSADEVAALGRVYRLIGRIYQRHQVKLDRAADRAAAGDGS